MKWKVFILCLFLSIFGTGCKILSNGGGGGGNRGVVPSVLLEPCELGAVPPTIGELFVDYKRLRLCVKQANLERRLLADGN